MGKKFNILKNSIMIASTSCVLLTGCKLEIEHTADPRPDVPEIREPNCEIDLYYRSNINPDAVEPVVICSVSGAPSYSEARCNMAFTAKNKWDTLPIVRDAKTVNTNFFGDADISISNGNCIPGLETVKIFAECIVDGYTLRTLNIGFANCGAEY